MNFIFFLNGCFNFLQKCLGKKEFFLTCLIVENINLNSNKMYLPLILDYSLYRQYIVQYCGNFGHMSKRDGPYGLGNA